MGLDYIYNNKMILVVVVVGLLAQTVLAGDCKRFTEYGDEVRKIISHMTLE